MKALERIFLKALIFAILLAALFSFSSCTCNNAEDSEDNDTNDDADDDDDDADDDDIDDDDTDDDAEGWYSYTVDSEDWAGHYTSIAVDSNNKVHISYFYDGYGVKLKYATNKNGAWEIFALDSSGGSHISNRSIAVDSDGDIHIVYESIKYIDRSYEWKLNYATNSSKSWQIFIIDSLPASGRTGLYPSIGLDSSDKIHIGYYECGEIEEEGCTIDNVKYATNKSGSWQRVVVDSSACGESCPVSIAIDSNDKVHICYIAQGQTITYVTNAYGAWTKEAIEDSVTESSIAVDKFNKAHLAYRDYGVLNYATNTSGSWIISDIDGDGVYNTALDPSIALDSNGKVHISYNYYNLGEDTSVLRYATNKSGSWETKTIDFSGDAGWYSSIAVDSDDYVHISYYDGKNKHLKYTTNRPPE